MYIPSQEQFQKVIDNLEKVLILSRGDCPVSMCVTDVETREENLCGTPMCHGGWYAAVCLSELSEKYHDVNYISYSDGAALMAEHLGFDGDGHLENWASDNPHIWGNHSGGVMFAAASAFGVDRYELTMQVIIDHWKGVKERVANYGK